MDIFTKYGIKIINGKRYYELNMNEKIYGYELENTIPYLFKYKDFVVQTSKWNQLSLEVIRYVNDLNPKSSEELVSMKYDFSKASVFSYEKKTNFSPFNNIFLNTNHTAGHQFRSLQTILINYNVNLDECYFLIRRHIKAEPIEVKNYFRNITMKQYEEYLLLKGYDDVKANVLIGNIDLLNKVLTSMNTAFNDFYLFDDYYYFTNYKSNFFKYVNSKYFSNEKFVKNIEANLELLDSFYKSRFIFKTENLTDVVMKLKNPIVSETQLLFEELNTKVISSNKIFSIMRLKYRELMNSLGVYNNSNDFFKICELLLNQKYRIKKPFISTSASMKLSNEELMVAYAYSLDKITVLDLSKYADKMHFKKLDNFLQFMNDVSDDYVQISIDTLIKKELFEISDDTLEKIKDEICFYINSIGSIDTTSYLGYGVYPQLEFKWNKYLLVGIVRTFFDDYFEIEYTEKSYKNTNFIIRIKKH